MKHLSQRTANLTFCLLLSLTNVAFAQTYGPDFDGDGLPDMAGYEVQSDGSANEIAVSWISSIDGEQDRFEFGKSTEAPVFNDYDGDGITDPAVVGISEAGQYLWRYKLSSGDGKISSDLFGSIGTSVLYGCHFDLDGLPDRAVLNSLGTFAYERSSDKAILPLTLGGAFDHYLCADLDGDGIDEVIAQKNLTTSTRKRRSKRRGPGKTQASRSFFHVWSTVSGLKTQEFEFGSNVENILAADINADAIEELAVEQKGSRKKSEIVFRTAAGTAMSFRLPTHSSLSLINFSGAATSVAGAFLKVSGEDRYSAFASFSNTSAVVPLTLNRTDEVLSVRGHVNIGPLQSAEGFCTEHMDPTDGPNGFLWKPVSDTTGNAVVILPEGLRLKNVRIIKDSSVLESLRFGGIANGNREHWRSNRRARTFAKQITVTGSRSGANYCWLIDDPNKRYD